MANITTDKRGRTLTTVFPAYRDAAIGGPQILEITVDSTITTTGLTATNTTMDVAVIPKNSVVHGMQLLLDTGAATPDVLEGATSTVNIGDGSTATLFGSSIDLNAAVNAYTDCSDTYYTAAAVVKITRATGTMAAAKFRMRLFLTCFN